MPRVVKTGRIFTKESTLRILAKVDICRDGVIVNSAINRFNVYDAYLFTYFILCSYVLWLCAKYWQRDSAWTNQRRDLVVHHLYRTSTIKSPGPLKFRSISMGNPCFGWPYFFGGVKLSKQKFSRVYEKRSEYSRFSWILESLDIMFI